MHFPLFSTSSHAAIIAFAAFWNGWQLFVCQSAGFLHHNHATPNSGMSLILLLLM
jgi:hypothetical protein